jgi:hypothetical protein
MRPAIHPLKFLQGRREHSKGMSAFILGGLLVALAGCGVQGGEDPDLRFEPDLGAGSDLSGTSDLSSPSDLSDLGGGPDLVMALDLATAPDLTDEPDLASGPDLRAEPDLTTEPDLTITPDLTTPPDLTVEPDLTVQPDLGSSLDLSTPNCDDGNPCTEDRFDASAGACAYTPAPAGTVCRAAAGSCDVAEICDGASTQCPTDRFAPSTAECRSSTSVCDPAETCSGDSPVCASDVTFCASLQLWLRADVGAITSDGRVTEWRDQSGRGRHASQGTVTRQPLLVNDALNGLPVLRFSGAQSIATEINTNRLRPSRFTVFVVGRNSNPADQIGLILGPSGVVKNSQLRWEDGTRLHVVGNSGQSFLTTPIGNTRVYHSLTIRFDGATMDVYRDGAQMNSAPFVIATDFPWEVNQIGAYYNGPFLVGDVAEIVIFDAALPGSEVAAVHAYLRSKYQLP